ncbi:MAG TPA: hypothetical protein VH206_15250 [Xanthobacteraceae bacterium]|jgi:hypothetical protein|nr:hypothetical protein [Xanthobacteraceae bacterium]
MEPLTDKPQNTRRLLGTGALVLSLLAILAASIWLAARTWLTTPDVEVPDFGYFYMGLGIVFSLIVGCGLMALVFYSSRHGYDEQGASYGEPAVDDTQRDNRSDH